MVDIWNGCVYCIHVYLNLQGLYTVHTQRICRRIGNTENNSDGFSWKPEPIFCNVERFEMWYNLRKHHCFPCRLSSTHRDVIINGYDLGLPHVGCQDSKCPSAPDEEELSTSRSPMFRGLLNSFPLIQFWNCNDR